MTELHLPVHACSSGTFTGHIFGILEYNWCVLLSRYLPDSKSRQESYSMGEGSSGVKGLGWECSCACLRVVPNMPSRRSSKQPPNRRTGPYRSSQQFSSAHYTSGQAAVLPVPHSY